MKTILVTGGAGFIGSNFIPSFLERNRDTRVVNLDKLTYAGSPQNLAEVSGHKRYEFVQADICNQALVKGLFEKHDFNGVIHFAAESHVDNSIAGPDAFIQTNINGTFSLLEAARKCWMKAPRSFNADHEASRFVHISTDEVYGSLGPDGKFTEASPYAPNSPYSASKASSDMLVRSYFHTYGLNTTITNCSNNYGPKQHAEKLIPTVVRKALAGQQIPIYGDGLNVRDWLYVDDHCAAVELAFLKGQAGHVYNIGGDNELTNKQLAEHLCKRLDQVRPRKDGVSYSSQISYVKDRPGHDRRYAVDAGKIKRELGWEPKESFGSGLSKTVEWFVKKFDIAG